MIHNVHQPIGSEFNWPGLPEGPTIPWPEPSVWFGLGRGAVAAWLSRARDVRLFVPNYFCPEVIAAWKSHGAFVERYVDDPTRTSPDWRSLSVRVGDIVVAVNYFGVRDGASWREWRDDNPGATLIEDHSHDPVSTWALESTADYAFASLRKTLPAPDGAILWSPQGHALPPEPQEHNWTGSALKLAGMIWKHEYLRAESPNVCHHATFRRFEIDGEQSFQDSFNQSVSPWSRALLAGGLPISWRRKREENTRQFISIFRRRNLSGMVELLFDAWPMGHCPLNPVLVCRTSEGRNVFRKRLIAERIFAAVHWPLAPECHETQSTIAARELSERILTMPLDFRSTTQDVERVVDCLEDTWKRIS